MQIVANVLMETINWDSNGLVCAVVQERHSLRILMVAWMNAEALQHTIESGYAHYYSRSRRKLWMKGEQSGHRQKVFEMRLDCDGDAIVLLVEQQGDIACHTGHASCFYRIYQQQNWQIVDPIIKSEDEIYSSQSNEQ